jgi:hypothetical protein
MAYGSIPQWKRLECATIYIKFSTASADALRSTEGIGVEVTSNATAGFSGPGNYRWLSAEPKE